MKKLVLLIVVILGCLSVQSQSSVILISNEKSAWNGIHPIGTDYSKQKIVFTSNSITLEGVKASLKSKTDWGDLMGDSFITLYDFTSGSFELYISGENFQLSVKSGSITVDYNGGITQSQIRELKSIY